MEQLQTENSAAGGLSDLTDVLGVAVSPAPTFPAVLDACCGGRMFWWNKENTDALFMDCREVEKGAFQNNWNPGWCVSVKEATVEASECLTSKGHDEAIAADQVLAGAMKPNLVSALIQRGALR